MLTDGERKASSYFSYFRALPLELKHNGQLNTLNVHISQFNSRLCLLQDQQIHFETHLGGELGGEQRRLIDRD